MVSVVALFIGVQGVDNAFVEEQLTSLLCEPEEQLTQVNSRGDRSGERTTTFYCEFSNGDRRDVTVGAVAAIGGAFVVPFLLGLLLVITGGIRMAKQRVTDFTQTIMSAIPDQQGSGGVQTIDRSTSRPSTPRTSPASGASGSSPRSSRCTSRSAT
jgi:hypothetical protein